MRELDKQNIEDIATGAAVLGTGGGGDPYIGKLMAQNAIEEHGPVELLDPEEVPEDALVVPSAMMGAPTVMVEKTPKGDETVAAFRALERYMGVEAFATMSIEAGGLNSTVPLGVAAALDMPIVDADGMGRAFPEIPQTVLTLGGVSATPMAMADEKGIALFLETIDNAWTERLARTVSVDMGGSALTAGYAMSGAEAKAWSISGSMSLCRSIGQSVAEARSRAGDPIEALLEITDGYELFVGKIADIERRTEGGFAVGTATIDGLDRYEGKRLEIDFQNENLVARVDGQPVATVPDLITVLDLETGEAVTTEGLNYGYRVTVVGLPCHELWRSEDGLDVVGPRAFGYDLDYTPIERLQGG